MQSILADLFTLYDKTVYLPCFNVNIISYFPCFRIVLSIHLLVVAIIVFVVKFSLVPRKFSYYFSYIISKPLNYIDKEKKTITGLNYIAATNTTIKITFE